MVGEERSPEPFFRVYGFIPRRHIKGRVRALAIESSQQNIFLNYRAFFQKMSLFSFQIPNGKLIFGERS